MNALMSAPTASRSSMPASARGASRCVKRCASRCASRYARRRAGRCARRPSAPSPSRSAGLLEVGVRDLQAPEGAQADRQNRVCQAVKGQGRRTGGQEGRRVDEKAAWQVDGRAGGETQQCGQAGGVAPGAPCQEVRTCLALLLWHAACFWALTRQLASCRMRGVRSQVAHDNMNWPVQLSLTYHDRQLTPSTTQRRHMPTGACKGIRISLL
jgi:hypothetical protein